MGDIVTFPRRKCGPGRPWLGSHTLILIDTPKRREAVKARVRAAKALDLYGMDPCELASIGTLPPRSVYAVDL